LPTASLVRRKRRSPPWTSLQAPHTQKFRQSQGRRIRTREVASIDRNVSLNRALWVLAEEMRKIKS
jgi:hypothetical protein